MVKIQIIEALFYNILTYTYLFPPLIFFLFWNKLKSERISHWVNAYAISFFLMVLFEESLTPTKFSTRLYYQSFTFFEYLFFTVIFWLAIKNAIVRRVIIILSISFCLFQVIYFFVEKFKRIDSLPIGLETILVLIYIFYFFYEQIKEPKGRHLSENHFFWFATGVLIYLSGSFFINILANSMEQHQIAKYWFLTYIADMVKNVFLAIGLFILSRHSLGQEKVDKRLPFLDMN